MNLESRWVEIDVGAVKAQGYFARPAVVSAPLPGVMVIHEAFSVDAHIRDVTERFATAGYAAFAPDLYSYGGKPAALEESRVVETKAFLDTVPTTAWFDRTQLEPALAKLPADRRRAIEETMALLLTQNRPIEQYVATLKAALSWMENPCSGQKVGSVGFCLGRMMALRHACVDGRLSATVVFYGMPPPLELVPGVSCPVLGLYAENDPRIMTALPALLETMKAHGKSFEHHVYPGAPHAFMNDTRRNYTVGPARDAWAQTLRFFAAMVGQS